jgi:hypothetical protein
MDKILIRNAPVCVFWLEFAGREVENIATEIPNTLKLYTDSPAK